MMEITQNPPAPMGTGRLNFKWKILFYFHKRVFLSRIEGILSAAAGHEGELAVQSFHSVNPAATTGNKVSEA
jgi:hypothetical protein